MPQQRNPTGEQYVITNGQQTAIITEVGATLRSYKVAEVEILDSFPENSLAPYGKGQILCPWPNRVQFGRYLIDETQQQLPINEVANNNSIHGLVRWLNWQLVSQTADEVIMSVILNPQDGYPFSLKVTVKYLLLDGILQVTTISENLGTETLPYGFGQHPYFLLDVDSAELMIPAHKYFVVNDNSIPIGCERVDQTPYDFRTSKPIGTLQLDTGFAVFDRDQKGRSYVIIQGTADNIRRRIKLWFDSHNRVVQIFTGDTLPQPNTRRSVAIEPYTCATNAFNNHYGLKLLAPGEVFSHHYAIEPSIITDCYGNKIDVTN